MDDGAGPPEGGRGRGLVDLDAGGAGGFLEVGRGDGAEGDHVALELAEHADDGVAHGGAVLDGADQAAEHGELELELDRVDEAFEVCLDGVEAAVLEGGVLDRDEGAVHGDEEEVDGDDLAHQLLGLGVAVGLGDAQDAPDGEEVGQRDGDLLQGEDGHLDLLHGGVADDPGVRLGGEDGGAVGEDGSGDAEDDGVDADEQEEGVEDAGVLGDEVESRPEHYALAVDHEEPAAVEEGRAGD